MGPAGSEGLAAGLDDVLRGVEVRFADLEVDDVLALGFQCASANEDLEGRLGAEAGHCG